jgi:hypothetical protein
MSGPPSDSDGDWGSGLEGDAGLLTPRWDSDSDAGYASDEGPIVAVPAAAAPASAAAPGSDAEASHRVACLEYTYLIDICICVYIHLRVASGKRYRYCCQLFV